MRRELTRTAALAVLGLAGAACAAAGARSETVDPLTEVVVTAVRGELPRSEFAGSLSRLDGAAIELAGAKHHAEIFNRIAGVHIQRNDGQESLTAIRSPVLSGPGSCGAFLVLEDGMPLRPTGFCNVNELFELNFEQAGTIEILRGPGPAAYGANALHGIVNVVTPAAADLAPLAVSLEGGPHEYRRIRFASGGEAGESAFGLYGLAAHDGGFREESGFEEAKLNLLLDRPLGSGELRLRAAGTRLDQQTAGFIQGFEAYRDASARRDNPNPEAFREAWSGRLAAQWSRAPCEGCRDDVRAIVRRSQMRFLQHFLLGKPLEENGQRSIALSAAMARRPIARASWRAGFDLEWADTELLEIQDGPTLEGPPAARAIRPAGRHYDYSTDSATAGAYVALDWQPLGRLRIGAALRGDYTRYDYDNRMLAGNTDEHGVPCGSGGCLFSRPADRRDSFANLTPKLDARFVLSPRQRLYLAWARGFRPPEATELYRLQRQQLSADLDSESLTSLEAGWLFADERLQASLAVFTQTKRDVILRDANAFNVSSGRTTHRGIEYELSWRTSPRTRLEAGGTAAWHRYDFSRALEGGETIRAGADIDTAPRHLASARAAFDGAALTAELEVSHVGRYFLNAASTAEYPGHTVLNARASWRFAPRWEATLRAVNLADRRYADRADFAFGDYRYFPGRSRSAFLEIAWRSE